MATRQQHYARRYQTLMLARGGPITLRAFSELAGPDPSPNPARLSALVVDGAHTAGATTLHLKAAAIGGRFIAGDSFLAGTTFLAKAASQVIPTNNACAVPLAAGLTQSLADGAAIAVTWAADKTIQAQAMPVSLRLVDGEMIQQRDLMVTVAANDLPGPPQPQWRIIMPDGDERSIVSIRPAAVDGIPVSYSFQAR